MESWWRFVWQPRADAATATQNESQFPDGTPELLVQRCKHCKMPLGMNYSSNPDGPIERAIEDELCNVCFELWRILATKLYWITLQREYTRERS